MFDDATLHLVGLFGKARSGVTHLTESCFVDPYDFTPVFINSSYVPEAVAMSDHGTDAVIGQTDPDMRQFLQEIHDAGEEDFGTAFWRNLAETRLARLVEHGVRRIVIPDGKTPEEARWVRSLGGSVVVVSGRGLARTTTNRNHSREQAVDAIQEPDHRVMNRRSAEDNAVQNLRSFVETSITGSHSENGEDTLTPTLPTHETIEAAS